MILISIYGKHSLIHVIFPSAKKTEREKSVFDHSPQ